MITRNTILLVLFLMAGCETNDNDGKSSCMGDPKVSACPDVLDPVCGCDGRTYENTCYASAAGVLSWTKGECN